MKHVPTVSIIVPCYNVSAYLKRCLDRLIGQTLSDIEIICIDDKSTDGTLQILQKYAQSDNRIILIQHDKNTGVATARNDGMKFARGKYIGFVDPDDYVDLDFYEKLSKRASITGADIVRASVITINAETNKATNTTNRDVSDFASAFWSAIYKADFLSKHNITFPAHIRTSQDVVFLTQVVLAMPQIDCVTDTAYHYFYLNPGSLDSNFLNHAKAESKYNALCMNLEYIENADISAQQRKKFIKSHVVNNILYEKDKTFEDSVDQNMMLELLQDLCDKYDIKIGKNGSVKLFCTENTGRRIHVYLCGIKIASWHNRHKAD